MGTGHAAQVGSRGGSTAEIRAAALNHASPRPGLSWADIGCGAGDMLREIRDLWQPAALVGSDLLPWLSRDLCDSVDFVEADALDALAQIQPVDRLLMVEVLEHVEAPWLVLRGAARKVAPQGILVLTTPNVRTARHRLELLTRGSLTGFRPDNQSHLTPVLDHVVTRVLAEEGMTCQTFYAGRDVVSLTRGLLWPQTIAAKAPSLLHVSLGFVATRQDVRVTPGRLVRPMEHQRSPPNPQVGAQPTPEGGSRGADATSSITIEDLSA